MSYYLIIKVFEFAKELVALFEQLDLASLVPRQEAKLRKQHAAVLEGRLRIIRQGLFHWTSSHPAKAEGNRVNQNV